MKTFTVIAVIIGLVMLANLSSDVSDASRAFGRTSDDLGSINTALLRMEGKLGGITDALAANDEAKARLAIWAAITETDHEITLQKQGRGHTNNTYQYISEAALAVYRTNLDKLRPGNTQTTAPAK